MKALSLVLATSLSASAAFAQDPSMTILSAEVSDTAGEAIGTVTVKPTLSGTSLVTIDLKNLPEGTHGVHLHETGDCSASDFKSAGGHIAGDAEHGIMAEGGPHPGDLPNATVSADGTLTVAYFNALIEPESMLMDEDGAAFIVHSGADDYSSQPSGDAGDRIACGVFEASGS